jgi:hypothetical protein
MIEKTAGLSVRFAGVARASAWKRAAIIGFGSRSGFPCNLADLNEQMLLLLNRPWFPRHSPSSENSVSHTLLETAA